MFRLPVVTGMFNSDDVIASTAGVIADILFKVEWDFKPLKYGERTKGDQIMRILLREHSDPQLSITFENFLHMRDQMSRIPGNEFLQKMLHYTIGMVINIYNSVFSELIHIVGNSVDDQQVVRLGDPNKNGSTNPTHSQLAKDHDNHPFHILAATLAKAAVRKVGKELAARWWENDFSANPAAVAAEFLTHPYDTNWQDAKVKEWASKNPKQIMRGESATEWEALEKAHRQEAVRAIQNGTGNFNDIWNYVSKNYEAIFSTKNQVKK
jgi:hypothetical protein